MPHPSAAMLRSTSSLRSLLHLSARLLPPPNPRLLRPPHPRLPSYPLSARPRFLSSSSSSSSSPPTTGGAGWATYDPVTDSLSASAALSSPSASDPEAPAESDAWAVFDPAAGRIIKHRSPPSSSTTAAAAKAEEDEEEEEGEGADEGEEKGRVRASARVAKAQTSWSSVAAVRKPAGKGGKERFSFVCSHCKEADSQWWGFCRHCNAAGTMEKYVPGTDGNASAVGSHHISRSWIPQKSKEIVPQSLQEVNKGLNQAEWRIPL